MSGDLVRFLNRAVNDVLRLPEVQEKAMLFGMEALGIERAWLHGEAAAASTVTWMALNHPEKLIGVIYESSGGIRFKEGSVKAPLPPVGGRRQPAASSSAPALFSRWTVRLTPPFWSPPPLPYTLLHGHLFVSDVSLTQNSFSRITEFSLIIMLRPLGSESDRTTHEATA